MRVCGCACAQDEPVGDDGLEPETPDDIVEPLPPHDGPHFDDEDELALMLPAPDVPLPAPAVDAGDELFAGPDSEPSDE